MDAGQPGSGIVHVRDRQARGEAFRVYLESAAACPWCVGVHCFTMYDESALGRFDGENWNIGFFVCNRPYEPLAQAARASHERMYRVAAGEVEPYDVEVEVVPQCSTEVADLPISALFCILGDGSRIPVREMPAS